MAYCKEDGTPGKGATAEARLGDRIRARREKLGLSQDKVAEELGWFAAQVDDCENGLFRPPSRDLFLLADLLAVEVSYFAEDGAPAAPSHQKGRGVFQALQDHAGAMELFQTYARIRDPRKRALLLDLAQSFAQEE